MCYDAKRERIVVFGGWNGANRFSGATLEWTGEALVRATTTGPSARDGHAQAPGALAEAGTLQQVARMAEVTERAVLEGAGIRFFRVDYGGGLHQRRHSHDYTSVSLVLSGGVAETVGRRIAEAGTLTVLVKPAGVEHACTFANRGVRLLSLQIDAALLSSLETRRATLDQWRVVSNPRAAAGLLRLFDSAASGEFVGGERDAVVELLAELAEPGTGGNLRDVPRWLHDAEACIRESFVRPTTRQLAQRAGVHPVHFARAFRRHFGHSPTGYAAWLRLRRASEMLVRNVAARRGAIALDAGFTDQSHMWREFRHALSITPGALAALGRPIEA